MKQIEKRLKINGIACTMWSDVDAEGRIVYAVRQDAKNGGAVEPVVMTHHTQKDAIQTAKDYIEMTF